MRILFFFSRFWLSFPFCSRVHMRTLSSFLYCSILLWCIVGEALAYGLSNEDKDHCPMDDSWPSIHIDSEYYISCPDEMLGAVSRRCVKIDNAPAWLEPNTTNCYHKSVLSSAPNGMLYSVIALNVCLPISS